MSPPRAGSPNRSRKNAAAAQPIGKPERAAAPAQGEALYLTGRPTVKSLIRYVNRNAVKPDPEGDLIDQWEAARKIVRQLEKDEAGTCDHPMPEKLGPEYEPLLIEFLKDPLVRNGFNAVPTQVAFVDLDRVVVYQKHIDTSFSRDLEQKLGPKPAWQDIFRTCLPYDHPQPPVKWVKGRDGRFTFISPSNDLRFLTAMKLKPKDISCAHPGNLVGVAGLAVGFGSNFLNAIYIENRLILNNGSHRAYTLRRMGITRVPCIVQHVPSREALEVTGPDDVHEDPDRFLSSPRPPMLRDYHDPRLHKLMKTNRRLREITIKFEVEEHDIPML